MALTLIGKAILGTTAGVAIIAPTTYFAVKKISTNNYDDFSYWAKNCKTLIINKKTKERIVICGPEGGGASSLTFYLQKEDIDPKIFNKSSLQGISSLSWKKKAKGGEKDFEMHITFKGEKDNSKIIAGDPTSEEQPKQNIENIEKNCGFKGDYLTCNNIDEQWGTYPFNFPFSFEN